MTKGTFSLVCDEIEELLPSCDFYSLDVEMTSLDMGGNQISLLDSPEERYGTHVLELITSTCMKLCALCENQRCVILCDSWRILSLYSHVRVQVSAFLCSSVCL